MDWVCSEWHVASGRVLLDARACELYGLACGPDGRQLERGEFAPQLGPERERDIQRRADAPVSELPPVPVPDEGSAQA